MCLEVSENHENSFATNGKGVFKFISKQQLILISLGLVDFTSGCVMSAIMPVFPHEATRRKVSSSISGIVFSIYALVIFLTSPIIGYFIPRVGPKMMLNIGTIIVGSCNILFGFLNQIDGTTAFISSSLAVRICEALGASMIATSSFSLIAHIFPNNIGSVLGMCEICVGLGLSVGPVIGGILFDWQGYYLPFFVVGFVLLLMVPINLLILPGEFQKDGDESLASSSLTFLRLPPFILTCLVIVVNSNIWGFLSPALEPHLAEFNLSETQVGLFFLLSSVVYSASSPLWGRLSDKMENTWVLMCIGLLSSALGLLLIGPSPLIGLTNTIWSNIGALLVLGTSVAMTLLPTFQALLDFAIESGKANDLGTYGTIAGLWSSMESLGEVIGPSLGGYLVDNYGFSICSTVMAGLCILMAMLVLIYFRCIRHHPAHPTQ